MIIETRLGVCHASTVRDGSTVGYDYSAQVRQDCLSNHRSRQMILSQLVTACSSDVNRLAAIALPTYSM